MSHKQEIKYNIDINTWYQRGLHKRAIKYLLDTNLWYQIAGVDDRYIFYCDNNCAYEIPQATNIQVYYDMYIGDKKYEIYKKIVDIIINDLMKLDGPEQLPKPEYIKELALLLVFNLITSVQGKELLTKLIETKRSPFELAQELEMFIEQNEDELVSWIDQAIASNTKSVTEYKAGKTAAANSIIGGVMKLSKGKANPQKVRELIIEKLNA